MRLKLIATATFGLEAVVKREIQALGYEIVSTENGHITFWGDERAVVRCNLWLRCADRVLLEMGAFTAVTFEELFQQTKGLPWEQLIPPDGKFTVIGSSVRSTLHSVPACQSIVKKAVVERLAESYGMEHFPETGAEYRIKVAMTRDQALLTVDTSGTALHKRGYRTSDVRAPLKETLAAALIQLSYWRKDRLLLDPCCGSGTIPIEAALIGRNIAPGLSRGFAAEGWELIPEDLWKQERKLAYDAIDYETELQICGQDISGRAVQSAVENAEEAGVGDCIRFSRVDIRKINKLMKESGVLITNLPYGKRISDEQELAGIYRALAALGNEEYWSYYYLTSDKQFERKIKRRADRKRKLFNGNLETTYYQFYGKRPEKKDN